MAIKKISKRIIRIAVASVCLIAVAAGIYLSSRSSKRNEQREYQTTAFLMDTVIEIKFFSKNGEAAAAEIIKVLTDLEKEISNYLPESEISKLNAAAGNGEFIPLSWNAYRLIEQSKVLYKGSFGMFDMTIAPLTRLWDITGESPRVPSREEILAAKKLVNQNDLLLDSENRAARLKNAGQAVDIGGIAKGYAADMVSAIMKSEGIMNGYVSLGGNLVVRGKNPVTGEDFQFGLRDPRGEGNEYIATLPLQGKTMATTGDYERFFIKDGVRYHHVLDPTTGYPVKNGLISVTVIGESGITGDFLSTSLFISGKDKIMSSFMSDSRFSLIVVDEELNVYLSSNLRDVVKKNPEKESYNFIYVDS